MVRACKRVRRALVFGMEEVLLEEEKAEQMGTGEAQVCVLMLTDVCACMCVYTSLCVHTPANTHVSPHPIPPTPPYPPAPQIKSTKPARWAPPRAEGGDGGCDGPRSR